MDTALGRPKATCVMKRTYNLAGLTAVTLMRNMSDTHGMGLARVLKQSEILLRKKLLKVILSQY
jgi:hypothetical protein